MVENHTTWVKNSKINTLCRKILKFPHCGWISETYKMYIMTPNDQISQHLSYFSGPKTSGAEIMKKIFFGEKKFKLTFFFFVKTHQHNKGYNRVFVKYFECEFPWQIQNQSISIHQGDLKIKSIIFHLFVYNFLNFFYFMPSKFLCNTWCHFQSMPTGRIFFNIDFCRYVYIAGLRVKY